jgi:hypothetical protein
LFDEKPAPVPDGPGGGEKGREKATLCARDRDIVGLDPEALARLSRPGESNSVDAVQNGGRTRRLGSHRRPIVPPHEVPVVAASDAPKQSASAPAGLVALDRTLRVTPSTAWPILVMLMAAVAIALVWSAVSHAPQRSERNGILLTPLGVADIPAEATWRS